MSRKLPTLKNALCPPKDESRVHRLQCQPFVPRVPEESLSHSAIWQSLILRGPVSALTMMLAGRGVVFDYGTSQVMGQIACIIPRNGATRTEVSTDWQSVQCRHRGLLDWLSCGKEPSGCILRRSSQIWLANSLRFVAAANLGRNNT